MPLKANEADLRAIARATLRTEAHQMADNNEYISHDEAKGRFANPLVSESTETVRQNQPAGEWVHADDATEAAMVRIRALIGQVNQPHGSGKAFLSAQEVEKALQLDPVAGKVLAYLRADIRSHEGPVIFTEGYKIPTSWSPEAVIADGKVKNSGGALTLEGSSDASEADPSLLKFALTQVWDRVLKHRVWQGEVDLSRNGKLRLGTYTDPESGRTFQVADWVDTDDASFTLYLAKSAANDFDLKIFQYNG